MYRFVERLKITAVSYLNTKPLLYGLVHSPLRPQLDITLDIPSECARKLTAGEVDLGLIPVAAIPDVPNARIVGDYGIGSVGAVKTVSIFSQIPIQRTKRLYLDFHSRTSIQLAQILLREYWCVSPELVPATPGFLERLTPTDAAVVIGDRTIGLENDFRYVYDLSAAWLDHTGLPFVFAAWVANRELPAGFEDQFNAALAEGIAAIPDLQLILPSPHPKFSLVEYFTKYISYSLDGPKRAGLELFLKKMQHNAILHPHDLVLVE